MQNTTTKIQWFIFFYLFVLSLYAQNDQWYVQVAVFDREVDELYFTQLASPIYHSEDSYGFHHYYTGKYRNAQEAQLEAQRIEAQGYRCTPVAEIDLANPCRCHYIPLPEATSSLVQHLFFDFDRYYLTASAQKQLDRLNTLMQQVPAYQIVLRAHTDARGNVAYNQQLSLRRAKAAKQYLIKNGIEAQRIQVETFGESIPIAKNQLADGSDTHQGRQLNRRVEITITDQYGHIYTDLVQQIEVPQRLQLVHSKLGSPSLSDIERK